MTKDRKHPKGLTVLFFTEMWERFNFYGMRALLSLFLADALMMGKQEASIIYGGFLGLSYLTPMFGGYISDKFLGNRNCILLGGTIMGLGQLLLFLSGNIYSSNLELAKNIMWMALLAIILGNGFFKPNISSMVGSLYPKEQKNKLDSAFTIFYLGINVGATLGQFICPFFGDIENNGVRDLSAFKWGFLAASIAMFAGTLTFLIFKNKYVVTPQGAAIGGKPNKNNVLEDESASAKFSKTSIMMSVIILIASTFILHLILGGPGVSQIKAWLYPFIFASGISLGYLIMSDSTLTKVERDRIWVLYIVCFFVMFFWGAFEQAGSSLTFIADKQTDTRIFVAVAAPIIAVSTAGQWDWQVGEAGNLGSGTTGNGAGLTITVSIPDMTSFAVASSLRLVGWNGTNWIDLSGTATATGNTENSLLSGTMVTGITAVAIGTVSWVLPLKLESFTANASNCDAVISWVSSNEINTDKFIVEQSTDNIHYTPAVNVKAKGNSNTVNNYSVTLAQPTGLVYYRLKMIDINGTYTYSNVIVCRTHCAVNEFMRVYPNPVVATGTVNLSFGTAYKGRATLIITNTLGQRFTAMAAQVNTGTNLIPVEVARFAAGTYFITLLAENGEQIGTVQKFIKQ